VFKLRKQPPFPVPFFFSKSSKTVYRRKLNGLQLSYISNTR
jgi:hypothetical protein